MKRQSGGSMIRELLTALALVAVACSSTRRLPACRTDAECGPALACVEERCVPLPEGPLACEVEGDRLDFGSIAVGATADLSLRLFNRRDEQPHEVHLALAAVEGDLADGAQPFALDPALAGTPQQLPASHRDGAPSRLELTVRFSPKRVGRAEAVLSIDLPGFCRADVRLIGEGVIDRFTCEPVADRDGVPVCHLDFGFAGGRTITRALRFRNGGPSPMMVTFTGGRGDANFGTNRGQVVVGAGSASLVFVDFWPQAPRAYGGVLTYSTDDPRRPGGFVEVTGNGGGPAIDIDSTLEVDFGAVGVETDQIREITVRNRGLDVLGTDADNLRFGEALSGTWIEEPPALGGADAADFSLVGWPGSYTSAGIAASQSVTFGIRFAPLTVGAKSATLAIRSNDVARPELVMDLGGEAVALPPCALEVVPPAVDFGTVPDYAESVRSFSLVNRSETEGEYCQVSLLDLVKSGSGQLSAFKLVDGPVAQKAPLTIEPAGRFDVAVSFHPCFLEGELEDQVEFFVSSRAQPKVRVPLVGTARSGCTLSMPPGSRGPRFSAQQVGCSSRGQTVTVEDLCACEQTIDSIEIAPAAAPVFTLAEMPSLPARVGTEKSASFAVSYRPTLVGLDLGAAVLNLRDGCSRRPWTLTIALTGDSVSRTRTAVFRAAEPQLDVIFVLDDGPSMADKQSAVEAGLGAVAQYLLERPYDLHLGVTTTDAGAAGESGRLLPIDGSRPKVITPSTPNAAAVFGDNANVGTSGSASRALLAPAYLALTLPLVNADNAGFYRLNATLAVVVVSDSADTDPLGLTAAQYWTEYLNLKSRERASWVSFSAIVPMASAAPAGCSYSSPNAADDPRARTLALWSGGVVEDICSANWSTALVTFFDQVLRPGSAAFFLPDRPDPAGPFSVTIDGQDVPRTTASGSAQWEYDGVRNAVVFRTAAAPAAGAEVMVEYQVECDERP